MRLAVDVTSLLDVHTGVAAVLRHHLDGLGERTGAEVVPYAVTWRGRNRYPDVTHRPMAAQPLRRLWMRFDGPVIERWVGDVDVVWGPNFVVPPTRGAARLATVHDLTCLRYPELCTPDVLQYPTLLRRAVAGGAHFHVVSRFVGDEVVELLGAPAERVHVVPNGVDPAVPGDPARGLARAGSERYVLAIGTVEPRKDHPSLVRAFAALASSHPDAALVIAGADGWGAAALSAALDEVPAAVAARVRRLGFVSEGERVDLVAGAAVLAYPSVYEGFGLPPLEAMAAGTPVVGTSAGALPEVLGDAADLVPVGDVDALAGALGRVLDDDEHRAALVERGRARAARWSWPEAQARLATVLRDLNR